jgi:RING finger/CHY zinc finger protein 1
MTLEEEQERRASIRDILQDEDLSPMEKRHSIQSLMDGRRRSSVDARVSGGPMSMAAAAAAAAAEFYDSSDDEDMMDVSSQQPPSSNSNSTSSSSTLLGAVPTTTTTPLQYSLRKFGRSASLNTFGSGAAAAAAAAAAAVMEVSDDSTDIINTSRTMETSRPPCEHYERNCTIISPCCGLAFGCRICHDECDVLPPPTNIRAVPTTTDISQGQAPKRRRSLPISLEAEMSHHAIDRFAIQEVICRQCFTRQSSKTNKCRSCGIQFGEYHCIQCNLWMSDEEAPYHCQDCGFCRVGGRENFRHCHDCGMCIDAQVFHNHNCKAGKYMSNCPVCQEDLFSSRSASHEMPCGHAIHWHCFQELTSYDTRCPVCKKTAETREQMASTWSAMAMGISLQPVPPEMARVVTIICNDCEERDENRQWHFLGVQCRNCTSFNTSVEKITLMGRPAAGAGISPLPPTENNASPSQSGVSVTL